MTTTDQTTAPETPAPNEAPATVPVFEYDGFSFGGSAFEESIPEAATKAQPRANALPFPAMFSAVEEIVKTTGRKAPWFIPARFWKERAKATTEITGSYQKDKLRGQFNKWKDEEGQAAKREGFTLLLVARTGKEGIPGIGEEGVSMWLDYAEPKKAETKAPAPEAPAEEKPAKEKPAK